MNTKKDTSKKYKEEIKLLNQQLQKCKENNDKLTEEVEYLKGKLIMESQDYIEEIKLLKQQLKNK